MQLQTAVFLRVSALVALLTVAVAGLFCWYSVHHHRREAQRLYETRAEVLARGLQPMLLWDDHVAVARYLNEAVKGEDVLEYAFLTQHDIPWESTFPAGVPPGLLQARQQESSLPAVWEFQDQTGAVLYDVAVAVEPGNARLHLGLRREAIDREVAPLLRGIGGLGLGAIATGALLAIVLALRTTREIRILASAVQIASGDDGGRELAIPSSSTEVTQFVRSFNEVVARHREAEEALRRSEEFLQAVISAIPDATLVINLDHTIALANQTARELAGGVDPVAGSMKCYQVSHDSGEPCRGSAHLCPLEQVVETGKSVTVQHVHRDAHGRDVPVELFAAPVFDAAGNVVQVVEASRDVTARVQAEAERVRLMSAVEQAAEAVVITDAAGKIQYANPSFGTTTGLDRAEAAGQHFMHLGQVDQRTMPYRAAWEAVVQGSPWSGRVRSRRQDGEPYDEEVSISPVRDPEGRVTNFVAVMRDISREVQLEDQLRHAQRLEAVGRLAGGVAHDFNNLLQVIGGYASLLQDRAPAGDPRYGELGQIIGATEKASALTRQLLAFGRRQPMRSEILDLNEVVTAMARMIRRIIGEHIELSVDLCPNLGAIRGDRGQIEQVLVNLCVNARDALSGGGRITLETRNSVLDPEACEPYPWVTPDRHAELRVADDGCGMNRETLQRVFEPFFTTKGVGEGTGLGLSTAWGTVRQHRGFIRAGSEEGRGSSFTVYLPQADGAVPTELESLETSLVGGEERLLLAEDDAGVRQLGQCILEKAGYSVLVAEDGEAALRSLREVEGQVDLLLLDVVMPRLGGLAVLEQVREQFPQVRAMLVSGYGVEEAEAGMRPGAEVDVLQKPYKAVELLRRVRQALDAREG